MAENILIFGRNSYAGNNFTRYAAGSGETVFASGSAECNLLDLSSIKSYLSQLPKVPFSVVFFAVVNKSADNSYRAFEENVRMIRNFLDASSEVEIRSLVYLGSADVYGVAPKLPITEDTRIAPDTWYGLAKYNAEWMLRDARELPYPVGIVRIPGVFGAGENDRSVIGKLVRSARETGKVTLSGGGRSLRDYVWVDDLSRLLLEVTRLRFDGVLNGVTGEAQTLREIVPVISEYLGREVEVVETPKTGRDFDLRFDNAKLRTLLPGFRFSGVKVGVGSYFR